MPDRVETLSNLENWRKSGGSDNLAVDPAQLVSQAGQWGLLVPERTILPLGLREAIDDGHGPLHPSMPHDDAASASGRGRSAISGLDREEVADITAYIRTSSCGSGNDGPQDGPGAGTGPAGDEPVQAVELDRGERLFDANCAACHGQGATGTTSGPPLVHEIYEPGHHSDESFQLAVARGSTQHHWDFGPMPAIPGLERDEVADTTAYIRELQREAGIVAGRLGLRGDVPDGVDGALPQVARAPSRER